MALTQCHELKSTKDAPNRELSFVAFFGFWHLWHFPRDSTPDPHPWIRSCLACLTVSRSSLSKR
jgi:hypothetical protein